MVISLNHKMKVLLTTEGTYPFHQGGVSTWCDLLVNKLQSVDYILFSVIMDPFVSQKFKLPERTSLIRMPLWGTDEPSEHFSTPFSKTILAKKRVDNDQLKREFIPLFVELIREVISLHKNPIRFGLILLQLYKYFQKYEYKVSFKSEPVWDIYKAIIFNSVKDSKNQLAQPDVYCMIQSIGWLYRFLNIVNTPIPKTNVTHSSAAAFCGIPCVLAKLQNSTPFLLTEHGVYLREQYLSLSKRKNTSFLNTFLIRLIHSVASLNYAYADQVSPVCEYNTRWEKKFGVQSDKIKVIYNGVDPNVFVQAGAVKQERPTVVTIARIDPIKDIKTLIRSAALVRERIPNVKYIVYGSVSVPDYYEECIELRDELRLQDTFLFAGHTTDMTAAYHSGDIIALSSISEAFPYSVVEAMMTGKPVVSTDVGGIPEALGDTGVLVAPNHPEELAQGITKLLLNPELREELGRKGRQRALNMFTLERVMELHLKSYIRLAVIPADGVVALPASKSNISLEHQRALAEKGYALTANGLYREGILKFRLALNEALDSTAAPLLILEIAEAYNNLGEFEQATNEMDKYNFFVYMLEMKKPA